MESQQGPAVQRREVCLMSGVSLDGRGLGREWTHAWLSPFAVHRKRPQHCELAILQDKIESLKSERKKWKVCVLSAVSFKSHYGCRSHAEASLCDVHVCVACQFEEYFSKDNRELVTEAASREEDWETLTGGKFHFNLKTFFETNGEKCIRIPAGVPDWVPTASNGSTQ